MAVHDLPLERRSLHGYFSPSLEPALTIEPGDSVRLSAPNGRWLLDSGEPFAGRDPELDTGHALTGPVEVRGARAGQTLVVQIDDVQPAAWGKTFTAPPGAPDRHHLHWRLAGGFGRVDRFEVRLAPFLGVMGMPPPEPGVHSTIPPRRWGGNIDCKELTAGATLFLPIPVDGARFSAGDGHALQGDGEVSGNGIECPTRFGLTLDVREDLPLEWPVARAHDSWITLGFDEDLDVATRIALDGMLELMQRELDVSRLDALALASVVVDLRVTQIVNRTLGVHAVLRDDALR